ncbi:MAG: alpha/beta fold hydrolase [Myxococcales bacterium]|nr:alpha/beta hydrolase [Myxococcales bacterium]
MIESEWIGPREGPTLVFLHEGLGSLGLWREFPRKLSERTGLGAFIYSRAGYGKSTPVPLPRPVRYMHDEADLLPQILGDAGVKDPILVGHSDGASIAIIYAGRGNKARALILEAPHVFTEEGGLASIAKMRELYRTADLREKLARWHADVDAAFNGWNGAWLDPEFRKWNLEEFLPRITAPILIVQGKDDEYGTVKQVEAIEKGAPDVRSVLLDQCGHSPHRDQPGKTLDAMAGFIRTVA